MIRTVFRRLLVPTIAASLLVAAPARGWSGDPDQAAPAPASPPGAAAPAEGETPTAPGTPKPEVVVTAPRDEQALPKLRSDAFTSCLEKFGSVESGLLADCQRQVDWEKSVVLGECLNSDGKTTAPRVVEACTELLDHDIIHGEWRCYIFVNRADAYFSQGDKERALEDYNAAVKLSPRNADLLYNRGVFYAAQSDQAAALRDFDTAIGINARHVLALRQRARIYQSRGNSSGALADFSAAIRLQPKSAALWSERGYVSLRQHDYQSAVRDEAEAIRLDPKLARAYFYRGAALGGLGNSRDAVSDLVTAVHLDPSLDRFVMSQGKNASLTLPPL